MKKTIWPRFRRRGGGFTLIELLVVIAIIVVLMGIALQVAKTANERTRRAQTVRTMEALRNGLAGYYSAYGQYPPGDSNNGTAGTYPNSNGLSILSGANSSELKNLPVPFQHGLLFYLMAFNGPDGPNNPDPNLPWFPRPPEKTTAQRWQHYLEGVPGIRGDVYATNLNLSASTGVGIKGLTNTYWSASDGWGTPINYTSTPPDYQSYRLWSVHMTNGWEE